MGVWHSLNMQWILKWNSTTEGEPKETGPQVCNKQTWLLRGTRVKLDCIHR